MNARTSAVLGSISNFVAIVLIGMSIGWLSGLSSGSLFSVAMPVLLTLIASALAAARLMGKPPADALQAISIYAIMVFVIGLAGGASLGTMARLGDWLAPDPERIIARWEPLEGDHSARRRGAPRVRANIDGSVSREPSGSAADDGGT